MDDHDLRKAIGKVWVAATGGDTLPEFRRKVIASCVALGNATDVATDAEVSSEIRVLIERGSEARKRCGDTMETRVALHTIYEIDTLIFATKDRTIAARAELIAYREGLILADWCHAGEEYAQSMIVAWREKMGL